MYCKNCGKEVSDNAVVCIHCGCAIEKRSSFSYKGVTEGEDKKTLGIWLSILLGLIGLIIGVCMYPSGSYERETFISGWIKGLIISIVILWCF